MDDEELDDFVQDDHDDSSVDSSDWEGKVSRAFEQHRSSVAGGARPQSAKRVRGNFCEKNDSVPAVWKMRASNEHADAGFQ